MIDDITTGRGKLGYLASLTRPVGRRTFLQWSGITLAVLGAGCSDQSLPLSTDAEADSRNAAGQAGQQEPRLIDLGSGDVGVLNYAYALEQMESAFYTMAVASTSFGRTYSAEEQQILVDLRDNEIAHREFYRAALGSNRIPDLQLDFNSINFGSRAQVLVTARNFEDIGVSAYNGAARLLKNPDVLMVAGKIASVEGRHAATLRDLLNPNSGFFAGDDVVNPVLGLDFARSSGEVLPLADPFIVDRFNTRNLPAADRQPFKRPTI